MHQQLPTEVDAVASKRSFYLPRASISSASASYHSGSSSKSSSRSRELDERRQSLERETSEGDDGPSSLDKSELKAYHIFNRDDVGEVLASMPSHSSSSSSSTSNKSNYSVNSLLLSVKNLENFNKGNELSRKHHHHHHHHHHRFAMPSDSNPNIIMKSNYYLNYFIPPESTRFPLYEHRWQMLQNIRNIEPSDEKNLPSISIQDRDAEADRLSMASSNTTTNFTVISLNDSSQRLNKSKKAICRRSHTISILIFVMTSIFVIFISVMLLLMDMRNQKMPR